jgi:molecular chaperone GrpE
MKPQQPVQPAPAQGAPSETKTASPTNASVQPDAPAPPPPVTADELTALRQKAQLADVHWDKYLRLAADFENYKKRVAREREEVAWREREILVLKLLPVLDALERGLAAVETQPPAVVEGLRLVWNMLFQMLSECGVQEIAAEGQRFNPVLHHAVSQEHSEKIAADVVLRQTRRGYRLGDRVLRAADVVVSLGASSAETKTV